MQIALDRMTCGRRRCQCYVAPRTGRGLTHCPAHEDVNPSLSVKHVNGQVLAHCFAGCDPSEVFRQLRKAGLIE